MTWRDCLLNEQPPCRQLQVCGHCLELEHVEPVRVTRIVNPALTGSDAKISDWIVEPPGGIHCYTMVMMLCQWCRSTVNPDGSLDVIPASER